MAKIEKKELKAIQELVLSIDTIKKEIGRMELEKIAAFEKYQDMNKSLEERADALKEKYGDINVDLSTGEYEEITEE